MIYLIIVEMMIATVVVVFSYFMIWSFLIEGIMRFRGPPPRWMQQLLVWASKPLPRFCEKAAYVTVQATGRTEVKFGILNEDPLWGSALVPDSVGHWTFTAPSSQHLTRAAAERAAVAMMMGGEL